MLELALDLLEGICVQQLPELRLTKKLAQLCLIDRERLRAAFRASGASPS